MSESLRLHTRTEQSEEPLINHEPHSCIHTRAHTHKRRHPTASVRRAKASVSKRELSCACRFVCVWEGKGRLLTEARDSLQGGGRGKVQGVEQSQSIPLASNFCLWGAERRV